MSEVRYRLQQTVTELQRPTAPIDAGPRDAHTLLRRIAARVGAERSALTKLHAERQPKSWTDLTPIRAVGLAMQHYDDIDAVQEAEIADLDRFRMGVNVINNVSTKLGITAQDVKAMGAQGLSRHVSMEAAVAAMDAFHHPDLRLITSGQAQHQKLSFERGERYGNADHLITTVEEIGIRAQEKVAFARAYYDQGRVGVVGKATLAGLDAIDAVRGAVVEVVDVAADHYAKERGVGAFVGALATNVGGAVSDVALAPATLVSPNAAPKDMGDAALEILGSVYVMGRRAGLKLRKMRSHRASRIATRTPRSDTLRVPRSKTTELRLDNKPRRSRIAEAVTEPSLPAQPPRARRTIRPTDDTVITAAPRPSNPSSVAGRKVPPRAQPKRAVATNAAPQPTKPSKAPAKAEGVVITDASPARSATPRRVRRKRAPERTTAKQAEPKRPDNVFTDDANRMTPSEKMREALRAPPAPEPIELKPGTFKRPYFNPRA